MKAAEACYSRNPSPPAVISFSASRLLYFLFMPLFHACCALFSFSFYYPVQSGFYVPFFVQPHDLLIHFFQAFLFPNAEWSFCNRAMDSEHGHEEVNSGQVMNLCLCLHYTCCSWFIHTHTQRQRDTHLMQCPCWPAP